jgi:type IV pilus assembly protein PilW
VKHRVSKGFTLVELMISLVLGLVVVGGVISVMLANKRSYRTNEGLAQIQESARTAFELMARDIRQAGGNGCDNNNRTSNLLAGGTAWWQTWFGVRGFESADVDTAIANGTATGARLDGTDSIHVQSVEGSALPVQIHNVGATTMTVNALTTPFVAGDIVLACDIDHAAMFQATAYNAVTRTLTHAASGANCSSGLGFPELCDGGAGNLYAFPMNSSIGRVNSSAWYVGNNGRPNEGGSSLYRIRLDSGGGTTTEEVVAGVTQMQLKYGINGSGTPVEASGVVDWSTVNSVFITLTADSADTNVSTDLATNSGRIERTFSYLITLRNRVP